MKEDVNTELLKENKTNRRKFLGKIGKAAVGVTAAATIVPYLEPKAKIFGQNRSTIPGFDPRRSGKCMQIRKNAAEANYLNTSSFPRANNGDESLYPNKIGSYSKGLPHQANGEVNLQAYYALTDALAVGSPARFEQIPLGGDRKLTNPQSGLAFDMEGADCFTFVQPPAPTFASREIAAEIAENYWMALLRDVPFTQYTSNAMATAAAADLTLFGEDFKGAKETNGTVSPNLLFRGLTAGDKAGPYMSQFWYLPCFFGANEINTKINTVKTIADGGANYMTDFASWLSVQNGVSPVQTDIIDPTLRYIRNGRDIGQWVHVDVLFQGYFQAFLCMLGLGVPFDAGNPYEGSLTQIGFGTFGGPHIATLLCEVSTRALKTVWNQKWFIHRRLRPEVFGGRVHRTLNNGANYPIHPDILTSINTNTRLGGFLPAGNALLPMAFPEGSPTHPAYGAGHGTVAGACATILKAWFDESFIIQNPVVPDANGLNLLPYTGGDTLTVGGELNKIASNIAIGRNIAGVHWRSDATESLKLGEAIAISILKEQKTCYNEVFNGFNLTKFDGTTIIV